MDGVGGIGGEREFLPLTMQKMKKGKGEMVKGGGEILGRKRRGPPDGGRRCAREASFGGRRGGRHAGALLGQEVNAACWPRASVPATLPQAARALEGEGELTVAAERWAPVGCANPSS